MRKIAAVLALTALAATGCGDDDSGTTAAPVTTAATTTTGATTTTAAPTTTAAAADASDGAGSGTSGAATTVGSGSGDHRVDLGFWPGSQLDTTSGAPSIPSSAPRITLEFTWADPQECFVWSRNVAASAGGGTRTNTATDFDLQRGADGVWTFTYRQNASRCGEGFATDGTVKTFRSDVLTEDPSTGQTGDALWAGVVEVVTP